MLLSMNLFLLASAFLMLFLLSELIFRKFKPEPEYTRKAVHIGTGLLTLLFPIMLDSVAEVLVLCISFMLLLIASQRWNLLPSINDVKRKTYGSLSYPIAVILSFWAMEVFADGEGKGRLIWFYLPVLTMAIADPAAALIGRSISSRKFLIGDGSKSLAGCVAFWIFARLVCTFSFFLLELNVNPLLALPGIGVGSMTAEAVSPYGLDNLTIPIAVLLYLYVFL